MNLVKQVKKVFFVSILSVATVPTMGQDLLARQAPVDRRATAVDTIALHMLVEREMA